MTLKVVPNAEGSGSAAVKCRWCRHTIATRQGRGRPREFCSQACRQWDWVARQRATELKLAEDELVVTRSELNEIRDRIFVLACAIDDVAGDIDNKRMPLEAMRESLRWLIDAARPVTDAHIGGHGDSDTRPQQRPA
ncbi:MAG: hypothetical protein FJW98_05475 [Actinobacteria bacterium]|nr:hypothetical protein [Actinomycetota bacterium]